MYRCGLLKVEDVEQLKELCPRSTNWELRKRRLIQRLNSSVADVYVVYSHDKVVGELTVAYSSDMDDERCISHQRVYIEAFRVRKDLRNQHYGTTLMNYVLNELYSRGFSEVTIGVEFTNERAKYIYDSFGFLQVLHTYPEYELLLRE